MTQEQINGTIRFLMTVLGTTGVVTAHFNAADWSTMTALILTLVSAALPVASFIWNQYSKRRAGIISTAAALPEVKVIVPQAEADSGAHANNNDVVGPAQATLAAAEVATGKAA